MKPKFEEFYLEAFFVCGFVVVQCPDCLSDIFVGEEVTGGRGEATWTGGCPGMSYNLEVWENMEEGSSSVGVGDRL